MRILLILLAALATQTGSSSVEPGYTSLVNGKDLTGWKIAGPPESFSVKDGAIVANGAASHAYYEGDTIRMQMNVKQVVEWKQPSDWTGSREGEGRKIAGPGTIALQAHDPKSTVYDKNIRIKPLD